MWRNNVIFDNQPKLKIGTRICNKETGETAVVTGFINSMDMYMCEVKDRTLFLSPRDVGEQYQEYQHSTE